ncbi:MAG: hypothetical protein Q8L57_03485 [bacterium]|nr:hypothetical protein [bacterium]
MDEKKVKFFLTLFVLAAAILTFWLSIISPLFKNIDKLKRDFRTDQKLLAILAEKERRFEELKRLNQEVEKNFAAIAETLLAKKDIFDFVVLLEDLARNSRIVLTIDHLPQLPEADKFASFRLTLWGSDVNIYKFLWSVENLKFWVNLNEIKITKLSAFTLPVGLKFSGLTVDDISSIVQISVFFSNDE